MQGDFGKAIIDYNEAIRLDPNLALAYVGRGNVYTKQGNLNAANADYATVKRRVLCVASAQRASLCSNHS